MKVYLRDGEALAASIVINRHVQPAAEEVLVHLRHIKRSADAYSNHIHCPPVAECIAAGLSKIFKSRVLCCKDVFSTTLLQHTLLTREEEV